MRRSQHPFKLNQWLFIGVIIIMCIIGMGAMAGSAGAQGASQTAQETTLGDMTQNSSEEERNMDADDDGELPPIPASYYGSVRIDDSPAPSGVTVEAEIDGEVRGSIPVSDDGTFGGPTAADEKLVVEGTGDDEGAEVQFFVEGENIDRTEADQTVEWESQANERINLTVSTNGDEGGVGGGAAGGGQDRDDTDDTEMDSDQNADDTDDTETDADETETDSDQNAETTDDSADGTDAAGTDDDSETAPAGNDNDDEVGSSDETADEAPGFGVIATLIALMSGSVFARTAGQSLINRRKR